MSIISRIKLWRLRRKFEAFWNRHPELHEFMSKEEGWINFCVCENLGVEEVRRQLELKVF